MQSGLVDLEQGKSPLICGVNMIHFRVKFNLNLGTIVLYHLIGVHISPTAFGEYPCVINFIRRSIIVGNVRLGLDNNVLSIDLDVPDYTVRWNRVLIDYFMNEHELPAPVNFVNVVIVSQGHDYLVLEVITVN